MLIKRVSNRLKRLTLCLGHENCADPDGDGGGTAEEEVDAEGGFGQKDWSDESDEEVGDLVWISMISMRWGGGRMGVDLDLGGEEKAYGVGALREACCCCSAGNGLDLAGENLYSYSPCLNQRCQQWLNGLKQVKTRLTHAVRNCKEIDHDDDYPSACAVISVDAFRSVQRANQSHTNGND